MKTLELNILILIIIQAFTLPVFCSWQDSSGLNKHKSVSAADTLRNDTIIIYTCPMHPEIQSDKPGNCPLCGMKLVKKSTNAKNKHDGQHKMGMMGMSMGNMNHSEEKTPLNMMVIAMGTMMGIMMIVMLVLIL